MISRCNQSIGSLIWYTMNQQISPQQIKIKKTILVMVKIALRILEREKCVLQDPSKALQTACRGLTKGV